MVLYRKYRPQTLADLIGQEHVKKTLHSQLSSDKISHAYLFSGPRGTGKTTVARILAKAVNCQKMSESGEPCNKCDSCLAITADRHLDVLEIDAASNRGIDDIRALRESIKLVPVTAKYKVYIVDEVHMLTAEAANALLKTLEEPPIHAIFVLCTTTPQNLPETIISRCLRFNFFPATQAQISQNLKKIADAEGKKIPDEIFPRVAAKSSGSFRDSVVLLEKIFVAPVLDEEMITGLLAGVSFEILAKLAQNLADKDTKGAILMINDLISQGIPVTAVNSEFVEFLRQLLFVKVGVTDGLDINLENVDQLKKIAQGFDQSQLLELLKLFEQAANQKNSPIAQLPTELAIAQFCFKDL